MASESESSTDLEDVLFDHCLGAGCPSHVLLNTGAFPTGWVDRYLELLGQASKRWSRERLWPRKVVAAIHVSSFYWNLRYDFWKKVNGTRNESTETALGTIRTKSERFLMASVTWRDAKNVGPES